MTMGVQEDHIDWLVQDLVDHVVGAFQQPVVGFGRASLVRVVVVARSGSSLASHAST